MKGLLLFPATTLSAASTAFGWWIESARKVGIELEIAFFEDIILIYGQTGKALLRGKEISVVDFVIMRGYCAELSLFFENEGIPVFNRWEAMALSHDKTLTHMRLCRAGISSPATFRCISAPDYEKASELVGASTFIVKQPDGSRGINVFLASNADEYNRSVAECSGNIIIQKYIESSRGRDLRVWTVGGSAVACVMRYSETSFLSNYSQGGKAVYHPLDPFLSDIAVKAAKTVGLDFAGVDVLMGDDGYTVCEVNGNAGFRTLSAVGGPDLPAAFLKYIADKEYEKYR